MPALEIRPLQTNDLPALMAVQRTAYGDGFMESTKVLPARLASPVNCSLALLLDGALCAYLAAYHSVLGKTATPLHGDLEPPVGTAPEHAAPARPGRRSTWPGEVFLADAPAAFVDHPCGLACSGRCAGGRRRKAMGGSPGSGRRTVAGLNSSSAWRWPRCRCPRRPPGSH